MSSSVDALFGAQVPTFETAPPSVDSLGDEAVDLAAAAGLVLDEWQADTVRQFLAVRGDDKWAAFECGLIVPRQNGKGAVLEAVELAGLFLLGERLIIHSAHEFKTAAEAFLRIKGLIENTPDLLRQVRKFRTAHGDESVELNDGRRLRFLARSRGSARGFSADRLVLDECYDLPAAAIAAMLPTLSAMPNPQVIYTTTTPPELDERSAHIIHTRNRAHGESPGRLVWREWSCERDVDVTDRSVWAASNPSLGVRVAEEFVENELAAASDPEFFLVERLGVWPVADDDLRPIPAVVWDACADLGSVPAGSVSLAVDVTPDRKWASVAVAGYRADGLPHVEVIEHLPGTSWVVRYVVERVAAHAPDAVVVDPTGPAGSLIVDLEKAGVEVTQTTPRDMAQACGALFDAVMEGAIRHRDQPVLTAAVALADTRPLADAWAWSRKSKGDISPLVAATLALSQARQPAESPAPVFVY